VCRLIWSCQLSNLATLLISHRWWRSLLGMWYTWSPFYAPCGTHKCFRPASWASGLCFMGIRTSDSSDPLWWHGRISCSISRLHHISVLMSLSVSLSLSLSLSLPAFDPYSVCGTGKTGRIIPLMSTSSCCRKTTTEEMRVGTLCH
jgi:hypothetical protein